MPKFKVAVSWEVYAEVEVEAETLEAAYILADEASLPEPGEYIDGSFTVNHEMTQYLNKEPKELYASNFVTIRSHTSEEGKGLTYPAFSGSLVEDAGVSEGWDVVDVRKDDGEVVSVYCFSIERDGK